MRVDAAVHLFLQKLSWSSTCYKKHHIEYSKSVNVPNHNILLTSPPTCRRLHSRPNQHTLRKLTNHRITHRATLLRPIPDTYPVPHDQIEPNHAPNPLHTIHTANRRSRYKPIHLYLYPANHALKYTHCTAGQTKPARRYTYPSGHVHHSPETSALRLVRATGDNGAVCVNGTYETHFSHSERELFRYV
jgi:hypothetical protein